jgi:hypothetical protein
MGCASQSIKHAGSSREFLPSSASKFTLGAFQTLGFAIPGHLLLSDHLKKTTRHVVIGVVLYFLRLSSPPSLPPSLLILLYVSQLTPSAQGPAHGGDVLSTWADRPVDACLTCGVVFRFISKAVCARRTADAGGTRGRMKTLTGVFTGVI